MAKGEQLYRRDLQLIRTYYQWVVDDSVEYGKRLVQHVRHGHPSPEPFEHEVRIIQGHIIEQHLECIKTMQVKYLDISALIMTQAMFASTPSQPDLLEPLWVQPLARLPFQSEYLVRGICLYNPYSLDRATKIFFEKDKESGSPIGIHRELIEHNMAESWCVDFLLDRIAPPQQANLVYPLLRYFPAKDTWELNAKRREQFCQTCQYEFLGENQIYIPCARCEEARLYWSRWLKTLLWTLSGKFRKPDDEIEAAVWQTTIVLQSNKKKKPQKATYHSSLIRYDASYFHVPHAHRGPMSDDHLILSREEALQEGAMEVDLDGVLVKDTTHRAGFIRHFRHPKYKKTETTVKPKDDQPQLVTLRTWKEREQRRAEHRETLVYASEHQQHQK